MVLGFGFLNLHLADRFVEGFNFPNFRNRLITDAASNLAGFVAQRAVKEMTTPMVERFFERRMGR